MMVAMPSCAARCAIDYARRRDITRCAQSAPAALRQRDASHEII